jgi:TonB family protein
MDAAPARVEAEWIQPKVDEAAHAALACVRGDRGRLVEVEVRPDGVVRGWVHPWPAPAAEQACVNEALASLRPGPSNGTTRSIVEGSGRLVDPAGARVRALSLRARAADQAVPVQACRAAWLARHPGAEGRVGLWISVDGEGRVASAAVAASTLDAEANACVLAAARALSLPPPAAAGGYRYSYLFSPRGLLVGAPDVTPVDPYDLAAAVAAAEPAVSACIPLYRVPGRLLLHVTFGNDGVPLRLALERSESAEEDRPADACVRRAARALRVVPFDGPPAEVTVPYDLR